MRTQTLESDVRRGRTSGFLLGLVLVLGGCFQEGPAGDEGPPGPPGPPGVVLTGAPASLKLSITRVAVAGPPTVDFKVTDGADVAFAGVTSGQVRFTFARLNPGANGDSSAWHSYINKLETPTVGPGTAPKVQATTDSGGEFVNHGDGSYSYTFGTNVTAVTSPLAVAYDSAATHRLGMSLDIGNGVPAVNGTYDFVPLTGSTTLIAKREIVMTASCNECHGQLAVHGGSRVDTKFCVTCHNPGSTDANSGNTVDFKVMVHKIHQGAELPSVIAGGAYAIYGFNNSLHDFSTVEWPQDTTNCTKCHDPADAATPQAINHNTVPTMQACGSCHDDVNFATGANHPGGVVTSNADCAVCHKSGGFAGSPDESHLDKILVEADNWAFEILAVTNSAPTQFPTVRYRIYNPKTNAAYALTDPSVSSGSLTARMAWDTRDYHNTGTATATSAPASAASLALLTGATNNGDGSYSKTFTFAVPAAATGSGAMSLEGRAAVDVEGPSGPPDGTRDRIPIQSFVTYFKITDASPVARREVVETARCQQCHGRLNGLVLHGGSRADNTKLCVMCHNPDNSDVAQRPVDPDGIVNGVNAAAGDGREEQSVDFRNLVHSIHSADMRSTPFFVYGNGGSTNDFSGVRFPGRLNFCETCHLPDTFYPADDTSKRLGVTLRSGSTVTQRTPSVVLSPAGANANHADDQNVTVIAAACRGCHDGTLAQTHMELNGALFTALQSALTGSTPETCAICHGPGRTADVKLVHGFGD